MQITVILPVTYAVTPELLLTAVLTGTGTKITTGDSALTVRQLLQRLLIFTTVTVMTSVILVDISA
jgi:hypothetical protein